MFGAVGTAGQRCTSTRRLIVHKDIYSKFKDNLIAAYKQLKIGNPLIENNHVGPLIDKVAVNAFKEAIKSAESEGGKLIFGGQVIDGKGYESGCYVVPALIEANNTYKIVRKKHLLQYFTSWNLIE